MWPYWKKCVIGDGLWGFKCSSQAQLHSLFLLSVDPDVELSATSPTPCLPVCHHNDNRLNLWNVSQAQFNVCFWELPWCLFIALETVRHSPYSAPPGACFISTVLVNLSSYSWFVSFLSLWLSPPTDLIQWLPNSSQNILSIPSVDFMLLCLLLDTQISKLICLFKNILILWVLWWFTHYCILSIYHSGIQ